MTMVRTVVRQWCHKVVTPRHRKAEQLGKDRADKDYTVHRLDADGREIEKFEGLHASTATKKYTRNLRRHPAQHHLITKGRPLPGMPAEIIAEHFGGEMRHLP